MQDWVGCRHLFHLIVPNSPYCTWDVCLTWPLTMGSKAIPSTVFLVVKGASSFSSTCRKAGCLQPTRRKGLLLIHFFRQFRFHCKYYTNDSCYTQNPHPFLNTVVHLIRNLSPIMCQPCVLHSNCICMSHTGCSCQAWVSLIARLVCFLHSHVHQLSSLTRPLHTLTQLKGVLQLQSQATGFRVSRLACLRRKRQIKSSPFHWRKPPRYALFNTRHISHNAHRA